MKRTAYHVVKTARAAIHLRALTNASNPTREAHAMVLALENFLEMLRDDDPVAPSEGLTTLELEACITDLERVRDVFDVMARRLKR